MSESGDNKYKWTPESTSLLVSVWSDKQVQKQLDYATKPQLIWESVARYMKKKGYNVSAKQCRSRMKQVLVCYRESKRAGTRAGVEQYYEAIERVFKSKRLDQVDGNDIDTVDSGTNIKSPPKDVKTNKNLQMRHKFNEPVQSLFRTDALSPTWTIGRENEYPDSPESNETIIARPFTGLSPTRDVAINTIDRLGQIGNRNTHQNLASREEPIRENYRQNLLTQYPYGEIPFQNTVQNVQNQIIQENMQQNQNFPQGHSRNQIAYQNLAQSNMTFQQNLHNLNQGMGVQLTNGMNQPGMSIHNTNTENILRQQNQLQAIIVNNRAVPQEPNKIVFSQNLGTTYRQNRDVLNYYPQSVDAKQNGSLSPDYSPDVTQNLNDAFCHSSKSEAKIHNLNETFNQPVHMENPQIHNNEASVLTNNATCNDDSLLLEFMLDSPTPSENECKLRNTAVNTDVTPNAPLRKKKVQKLEQLVLSAINSQNEVVNKILASQNDMMSRFLDIDRDRQNRLENRLDHLLNVVHATALNKGIDAESELPPLPSEPTITALVPPPKPGVIPPKLDLVPPKPCRVPCTVAGPNVKLVNQEPVLTRPGVISPITSPGKKLGTIWSKLGPVSQSPFVRAQQRLGLQPISNTEIRTQSSAERRIAREVGKMNMDTQTLIFETTKFLEMERLQEEKVENARLQKTLGQNLTARRKLFTQKEPSPAMVITAAFLEAECQASEQAMNTYAFSNLNKERLKKNTDDLLAGQGEGYERLRQLDAQTNYILSEPCDSSTPARPAVGLKDSESQYTQVPKPSIHQLAQLVMNSARWKDAAERNQQYRFSQPVMPAQQNNGIKNNTEYNAAFVTSKVNPQYVQVRNEEQNIYGKNVDLVKNGPNNDAANEGKFVYAPLTSEDPVLQKSKYPMGFTTAMLDTKTSKYKDIAVLDEAVGSTYNTIPDRKQQNVRFMDEALAELHRMYIERNFDEQRKLDDPPFIPNNGVILTSQNQYADRYMQNTLPRKNFKDKDNDSDNDDEFLDTTASIHLPVLSRKGSLTSTGTASTEVANPFKLHKPDSHNCIIS